MYMWYSHARRAKSLKIFSTHLQKVFSTSGSLVCTSSVPPVCLLPSGDPCPCYGSEHNLRVSFLLGTAYPPLRFHTWVQDGYQGLCILRRASFHVLLFLRERGDQPFMCKTGLSDGQLLATIFFVHFMFSEASVFPPWLFLSDEPTD